MPTGPVSLHTEYAPSLVALSIVIATLASYAALDLAGRTSAARGRARAVWNVAGAVAMGMGIWSMHFIGMIAFQLQGPDHAGAMTIWYARPGMLLSIVFAIAASALALRVVSHSDLRPRAMAAASFSLGGGIAGMHYIGMAAMRMQAALSYDPTLVAASIGIAVGASWAALWLSKRLGNAASAMERLAKLAAAAVMGVAIAGMHYTGMAAARFATRDLAMHLQVSGLVASGQLATAVAIAAICVLTAALVSAALDRGHHEALDQTVWQSEARFRAVSEAATDAIVSTDAADRIVFWNDAAERIFGYASDDVIGQPLSMLIPGPHGQESVGGGTIEVEDVRHDGVPFPIELSLSTWESEGARFYTRIMRDITARRRAQQAVHESETRYRQLVERSPECIVLHVDGVIVFANPAAAEVLGAAHIDDVVGRRLLDLVHVDSRAAARERLERVHLIESRTDLAEFQILTFDGRTLDVETASVPVWHEGRRALQTHVRDVTPRKALERQLVHEAFHDPLTGLANRLLFHDRVAHALERVARGGPRPVVLFLDLDNFKRINDGWGHHVGDQMLVQVAARVLNTLRSGDTCARLGGDEFAILLEEPDGADGVPARAAQVAERIVSALEQPISCDGVEFAVGVSVGIAAAAVGDSADDLLRNADLAMYRAKASGKGRYELFEPAMHAAARKRIELEADLRRLVERDCEALVVHYQPIASIASGRITGFEALVRWRRENGTLVAPDAFIPVAEETGLIVPIGRHVLNVACRQARDWQDQVGGDPLTITVNLSARQLLERELPRDVAAALAESGLEPSCLVLEITESMLIDDSEATLGRLRALKALGVRLAIDDFGTGFSSLRYLERFPVDLLKIDKSFVDGVGGDADESPLARAILGLGGALGMRVVAEGIETAAQWTRLRELGCELGQGYYLARPQAADAAGELLDRQLASV